MNMTELRAAVFAMFQTGRYADALALIEREEGNLPTQLARLGNWKATLFGRLGQPEKGLAALNDVVRRGGWYSERYLMGDRDLQPVRDLPGFQDLLSVCRERHAAALAQTKSELHTYFHGASDVPAPLVLALHGNMSSASVNAPAWAPAVEQGCYVGLAQSSQIEAPEAYVWDDWEQAETDVAEHYRTLTAYPAVDPNQTVLGGFSMGGGAAAWMAVTGAVPVRGFIVVGPYFPSLEMLAPALAGARARGVRGYILIGEEDHICLDHARGLFDLLRSHDIPVEIEVMPGVGHTFPADFGIRFARALAFVLAGQ